MPIYHNAVGWGGDENTLQRVLNTEQVTCAELTMDILFY